MARGPDNGLTIRRLREADAAAVQELAGRDSAPVPEGELLGIDVEGRLVAVQPLAGGQVIADPFARTAEVRALLELRAAQLRARADGQAHGARAEHQPAHRLHPHALFGRAT